MIRKQHIATGVILAAGIVGFAVADSNIDTTNKYAWGENIGFLNFRDANGTTEGVKVNADHLEGFIWAENVGWINVGNGGGPYTNTDNTNFGINIDGAGNLTGYAWGENIGWVNFSGGAMASPAQPARLDPMDMRFRGYAWGENVGWINLDDNDKFVGVTNANDCRFDINGTGAVDIVDFTAFATAFGSMTGDPNYDAVLDFNGTGSIDIVDFTEFSMEFGRTDCLAD